MRLDFVIPVLTRESGDPVSHDVRLRTRNPASGETPANHESGVALWILAFARMTGGAHPSAHAPGPANKNGKGSLRASDAFM